MYIHINMICRAETKSQRFWLMYVCVYTYMYVCMYVYMYYLVCWSQIVALFVHVCMYECVLPGLLEPNCSVPEDIFMLIKLCLSLCVYIYLSLCVYIYI
jgi:hypothetical protein